MTVPDARSSLGVPWPKRGLPEFGIGTVELHLVPAEAQDLALTKAEDQDQDEGRVESFDGTEITPHHSVAVQLFAQEAKAWARIGDRRQTEVALDRGRSLLENLPYRENLDHHFVVDPSKFDFYAMDCYRALGANDMAETLAGEVIHASTDFDGRERAPMRLAEARITLGVVRAREGDLDEAVNMGTHSLNGSRKSLPSLLMVSRDLTKVLRDRYPGAPQTRDYLEHLNTLAETSASPA